MHDRVCTRVFGPLFSAILASNSIRPFAVERDDWRGLVQSERKSPRLNSTCSRLWIGNPRTVYANILSILSESFCCPHSNTGGGLETYGFTESCQTGLVTVNSSAPVVRVLLFVGGGIGSFHGRRSLLGMTVSLRFQVQGNQKTRFMQIPVRLATLPRCGVMAPH
jgi:hypothetical protein